MDRKAFSVLEMCSMFCCTKSSSPLAREAEALKGMISLVLTGKKDVWTRSSYLRRLRHMGTRRVRVMKKLDESKVRWILSKDPAEAFVRKMPPKGKIV